MSDQYNSGNSDRSGATPWNSPDGPSGDGRPHDQTTGHGAGGGGYDGGPSYSQASYPESAYSGQGAPAQSQYGAYGSQDTGYAGAYDAPKPQGMAIAALVFGIIALLLFFVPAIGFIFALVAIILGAVALRRVKRGVGGGRGLALGGVVTGVLAAILNVIITVIFGAAIWVGIDAINQCSSLPTEQQQRECSQRYTEELFQPQGNPT